MKLYEVPFTFLMKGSCFVMASDPIGARTQAEDMVKVDWENFAESALFFDPANADRVEIEFESDEEEIMPYVEFQSPILSDRKLDEFDYPTVFPVTNNEA